MEKINLLCLGWTALALIMGSCAQEDIIIKEETGPENRKTLSIRVTDGGYYGNQPTRADESNEEEYNGDATSMRTRFIAGDKIGVFSISGEGATHYQNLELAFDGTEWKNPEGEPFYYFPGMKYFAYYPYDKNFNIDKVNWNRDSAAGFFSTYINEWMPLEDQSTTLKYIASDLMVGDGGLTEDGAFTFILGHTMGLIFISAAEEIKGTVYLFPKLPESDAMETLSSDSKIYDFEQKVFKPSRRQGYYRYLVKPGQSKFISGKNPDGRIFSFTCSNVSAGRYKKFIIDGGFNPANSEIEDFTVQIGDVLFNDMHIKHRPADGTTLSGDKAGIIVYLADFHDEYTEGYTHGLVLANELEIVRSSESGRSWTYDQYTTEMADHPGLANCSTVIQALNDKSGLTNSLTVGSTEGLGDLTRDHTTTLPIYSRASKWFTLSAGQWIKILEEWGATLSVDLNNSTKKMDFTYNSKIQPGNTVFKDDFKYLWTSHYPTTNTSSYSNPTENKYYAISSTEANDKGTFIWMFKLSKTTAPYGERKRKDYSDGRVWRGFAF